MKKVILSVTAVCIALLIAFAACSGNEDNVGASESNDTAYTVQSKEEPASESISESETETEEEKIEAPLSAASCKGMQYKSLADLFENAGFTDIEAVSAESKTQSDGSVTAVTIDGKSYFGSGDVYSPDAKIVITYAVAPETEPTVHTTEKPVINENMVWIPSSGKKYHSNSSCSNMTDPSRVTVSRAKQLGYTPCKKCYG